MHTQIYIYKQTTFIMFKTDCMRMAYEIKHVTKQYCIYVCVCIHRVCMCVCAYMFCSVHASILCVCVGGGGGVLKESVCACVCEREKVYIFVCQRGRESTDIHKPNQCS